MTLEMLQYAAHETTGGAMAGASESVSTLKNHVSRGIIKNHFESELARHPFVITEATVHH